MKNQKLFRLMGLVGVAVMLLLTGCEKPLTETPEPRFSAVQVVGKWVRENTHEYWRFDSGYAGETWDEGDDVQEGEGTRLGWGLTNDVLNIELYGEMGQVVPYDYAIVELNDTVLKWKDNYANVSIFRKVK